MAARNAPTYAKWIAVVHTPFVFVAFAAGVWRGPRRLAVVAVAGLVLGILPYLFKGPYFDDFGLIRYILPALVPCVLVAVIGVGDPITRYLSRPFAAVALLLAAVAVSFNSYRVTTAEGIFRGVVQESKYAAVGDWVRDHTPLHSVVMAEGHSGSVRFYAHRTTLRSDVLPPDELAATVREMTRRGIACFAALDGEEEERPFRARFARDLDQISRDPIGRVRGTIIYRLQPKP
jgi:hypothetical protein